MGYPARRGHSNPARRQPVQRWVGGLASDSRPGPVQLRVWVRVPSAATSTSTLPSGGRAWTPLRCRSRGRAPRAWDSVLALTSLGPRVKARWCRRRAHGVERERRQCHSVATDVQSAYRNHNRSFTARACVGVRPRPGCPGCLVRRRTPSRSTGSNRSPGRGGGARPGGDCRGAAAGRRGLERRSRRGWLHARSGWRALRAGPRQDRSRRDLAFTIRSLPRARIVSALHGEQWPDADPPHNVRGSSPGCRAVLVGARLHRRSYYRFSLD